MVQLLATEKTLTLGLDDFARLLGVAPDRLPRACGQVLAEGDMSYRILQGAEREECLLQAVRPLAEEELERSGPARRERWEQGWGENLREFRENRRADLLRPKYMKHTRYRLDGEYIQTGSSLFEDSFYTACRIHLFSHYLAGVDRVVEFGCGTGTSLLLLGELHPGKTLVGCDWAESSQQILAEIAKGRNLDLTGVNFDMFNPHDRVPFAAGAGVMTFTAMEQLGDRFTRFAEYLLEQRPGVCIHIEPTPELYDQEDLFDYMALAYHRRRNYLTGFLPWLRQGEKEGRLEILEARRLGFGSFYQEAYTILVWRPR